MKAVIIPAVGAPAEISTDTPMPEPSATQLLVKTLSTAINPVDALMANMGLVVESFPLVPGCDAAGVVVEAGPDAVNALGERFKEGDAVFGCTRVGVWGYAAWQEYFLFDAHVAIPKPKNLSFNEAAATGAGVLTAFDGLFHHMGLPLLDPDNLPEAKGEWALVFGGASTVGRFAVQTLKLSGYKVVTTCSAKSFDMLAKFGADATVDYSKGADEIVAEIKRITGDQLNKVFDAVAINNALASTLYAALPASGGSERVFVTTNDWDPAPDAALGFRSGQIEIGPIGRPDAKDLDARIGKYIPVIFKLLEKEKLTVGEYTLEGEGIEGIPKAWEVLKGGKAGSKKVVVKVADA